MGEFVLIYLLSYDTNSIYVYELFGKKEKKKGNMVVFRGELGRGRGFLKCHCLPFVSFILCLMNILLILSQIHKYVFFNTQISLSLTKEPILF